ncbi:MAG: nuclear transport factor 2 family protein [Pseudomonadota bacterium]
MKESASQEPLADSVGEKQAAVEALIAAWKRKDVDGVLALLCDDVEYHYLVGERPLKGKDWVRRFLDRFREHIGSENNWRLLRCAEAGDALLVEGVDDYRSDEGAHVRYPYMGVFEFRDGRIARWRDYADPALIAAQRDGKPLPEWLEPLVA